MSTDYWWCWLALGVNLAYIFLLNGVLVLCLSFLPPYGANAVVAKTEEELYDRHVALYGDASNVDDIVVEVMDANGYTNGCSNGHATDLHNSKAEVSNAAVQLQIMHVCGIALLSNM